MNDRELLELAAKAAGYEFPRTVLTGENTYVGREWNPLADDGDALRLAVALRIQITPGTYGKDEANAYSPVAGDAYASVGYDQDMLAATRRAIVRAAAEIGRAMQ